MTFSEFWSGGGGGKGDMLDSDSTIQKTLEMVDYANKNSKRSKNTFFSNFPIFCRSHMQVHIPLEERKPLKKHFLCSYCGRSFSNSSNLTVHIRRYSSKYFTLLITNPNQILILFFLTDIPENDHLPVIFATPVSQDHLTYNVMCARTPEKKSVILNLRHFIESFYSIVFIPILTGVCNVCGKGMYY